jgi:TPR repeat protein
VTAAIRPLAREAIASPRVRVGLAWLVALAFVAGAVGLARVAQRVLPERPPLAELAYYPSGRALRPASLGHGETAADLAWLRAVQYYGEHRRTDLRFLQLEHVFNVLTTLAPRFESPYVFGAFALAQEGRDFAGAERLMHKGLAANPGSALLAFEMGFLYFVRPGGRDLARAAEFFERAARLPGAPPAAARFAAYTRQHAGDLAVALLLWDEVRRTSPNRLLREMAEREIAELQDALRTGRKASVVRRLTTPQVLLR